MFRKKSDGLLLGFNVDGDYDDVKIDFSSGDEVFLITDGIIESRNPEGKGLEIEGLKGVITNNSSGDAVENIVARFTEYTSGNFEDDVSLIYIKAL